MNLEKALQYLQISNSTLHIREIKKRYITLMDDLNNDENLEKQLEITKAFKFLLENLHESNTYRHAYSYIPHSNISTQNIPHSNISTQNIPHSNNIQQCKKKCNQIDYSYQPIISINQPFSQMQPQPIDNQPIYSSVSEDSNKRSTFQLLRYF